MIYVENRKHLIGSKESAIEDAMMVAKVRPEKDWFIFQTPTRRDKPDGPATWPHWSYTDTPWALPVDAVIQKVYEAPKE